MKHYQLYWAAQKLASFYLNRIVDQVCVHLMNVEGISLLMELVSAS